MNRNSLLALGFGVLLVAASVTPLASATPFTPATSESPSLGPTSVASASATSPGESSDLGDDPALSVQSDGNVTVMDAMLTAQNETNGTAIGVEREREDSTPVWEVEILREDGARFEVDVHTETAAVLEVDNGSLLGGASEGFLPANRTRSLDRMRSGVEAVRIAENRSVSVASITRVDLEVESASLVYEVTYSTPEGDAAEVRVPAVPNASTPRTG